jgi:glyoxylase-like metal-dependent hydrolase (beta-lactamase superfamily II)
VWNEVGDNCFVRRYERFDVNVGVVRGSGGLLVIDTRGDHREATELLGDLRALGPGPVRWVANTHSHFDHVFGNGRFTDAAEGEPMPSLVEVSNDLEIWGHLALSAWWSDDYRHQLLAHLRESMPAFAEALDEVVITLPDHLVDDSVVLDLGDRSVELRHFGRAHTDNDLVVVVPDAGVVFAGDIVEESAPPAFGDDSFPLEWPETLHTLERWLAAQSGGDRVVVPGHGAPVDLAFVSRQRGDLTALAERLSGLHTAGVSVDDALRLDDWPFPTGALGDAVARAYAQLNGAPLGPPG